MSMLLKHRAVEIVRQDREAALRTGVKDAGTKLDQALTRLHDEIDLGGELSPAGAAYVNKQFAKRWRKARKRFRKAVDLALRANARGGVA